MFAIGLLSGLVAGVPLFLPIMMGIGFIMWELRVPTSFSSEADLLVMIVLYGIWLLVISATVRRMKWRPFFHGFLCSMPLPTILIGYAWQSSLSLHH
jgi:hypothetical protein